MKRLLASATAIVVAAVLALNALGVTAAAVVPGPPLADAILGQIYAGKTWFWKDGAAYFAGGGQFKAWSRTNSALNKASGTWYLRGSGVICFSAAWRTPNEDPASVTPVETCLRHAVHDGDIMQMKEPNGEWYVFKHRVGQRGDEINKFAPGDHTDGLAD